MPSGSSIDVGAERDAHAADGYVMAAHLLEVSLPTTTRALVLAAGAAAALAPLVRSSVTFAADRIDAGDVRALNASLSGERTAYKIYDDALASKLLSPPVAAVLTRFQSEHGAHRDALAAALTQAGQTPGTDAAPAEPESFRVEADVLSYSYALERALAAAFLQTVGPYKNRDYATLAASILGVTTARVALLGEALQRGPAYPTALVTP
jgi:hypothetical protein